MPDLEGVEELPVDDLADGLGREVGPHLLDQEAELADVGEADLVGGYEVRLEQLDEAVLGDPQVLSDLVVARTPDPDLFEVLGIVLLEDPLLQLLGVLKDVQNG